MFAHNRSYRGTANSQIFVQKHAVTYIWWKILSGFSVRRTPNVLQLVTHTCSVKSLYTIKDLLFWYQMLSFIDKVLCCNLWALIRCWLQFISHLCDPLWCRLPLRVSSWPNQQRQQVNNLDKNKQNAQVGYFMHEQALIWSFLTMTTKIFFCLFEKICPGIRRELCYEIKCNIIWLKWQSSRVSEKHGGLKSLQS